MKPSDLFSTSGYLPLLSALLAAALLAGTGCGSEDEASSEPQNTVQSMAEASKQMEEMSKKMKENRNKTVEPVNFRKLRALLPEAVADSLEQTAKEGQTGGAMGMNVSSAEATYESESTGDRSRVEIKLTDMGAMSGFGAMGFGWAMMNIDKETSSGYEKTTNYDGHKAHEKYDRDRRRGEMQVLVADRFVVEVEGRDVEMETIKDALGRVDLPTLEGMKDEGVQES